MAASWAKSTSSSSIAPQCKYDVFLSFSGIDTRKNFTGHLLAALERHGFYTFRDDKKLKRGEDIGSALLEAIEESRISVIMFSENYAASSWCLDELVKIMECRKTFQQTVLPIFYDIVPFDMQAQNMNGKVKKWRAALTEAANLSGWDLKNVDNGLIEKTIEEVGNILDLEHLSVADHLVGLEDRVQELSTLLGMESNNNDVCIVALWGIGGRGKITIAKKLYNLIHRKFDGNSFLANVRETWKLPNEDVLELFRYGMGTDTVKGLFLNFPKQKQVQVHAKAFEKMNRLWVLHLNNVHLSVGHKYIFRRLLCLSWNGFPLECLPLNLYKEKLVVLDLHYSRLLKRVWKGTKRLEIVGCNVSYLPNEIKRLSLLIDLDLEGNNLCTLPDNICNLTYLEYLSILSGNVSHLPSEIGELLSLKYLNLDGNNLCTLPKSFYNLIRLERLDMANCNVSHLPSEIWRLQSLEMWHLGKNNLCSLPDSISNLTRLLYLYLDKSARLQSLPKLSLSLSNLYAKDCALLENIELKGAVWMNMSLYGCHKLAGNNFANEFIKVFTKHKKAR
ncbi:unnamed protein product [Camellia sinensis]